MKKLTYIIPVLILALILIFAPACNKTVPTIETVLSNELLESCRQGNLEDVKRLLEQGADVNAKDITGNTALMSAAANGQIEIAEILIDKGIDVNAKNNDGRTALMSAAASGHTEIVNLLREAGARE